MLYKRIITALVLLPLVLALFYLVPLETFALSISLLTYLLAQEWGKLAGLNPLHSAIYGFGVAFITLAIRWYSEPLFVWPSISWPQSLNIELPLLFLLVAAVISMLSVVIVLSYKQGGNFWSGPIVKSVLGGFLLPGFFVALISIRRTEYLGDGWFGAHLLLFMFVLIWAADTGAFIAGKALGRRKLAPKVSPNKTIEGAAGGVLLSVAVGSSGILLLNVPSSDYLLYVVCLLLLAVLSVFGDLFESVLKREAGVKDSGNLLPGHGGVLDRLDSSIVVAPVFFLLFSYMGWV